VLRPNFFYDRSELNWIKIQFKVIVKISVDCLSASLRRENEFLRRSAFRDKVTASIVVLVLVSEKSRVSQLACLIF
jgi:hypothetical protein